jgi:dienelactone hydrolase
MKYVLGISLILALAGGVEAKMVTKTVAYRQDGTVCKGYLAYDDALPGPRPGVLVVHEWYGLNDFARKQAENLAVLGYAALAADIYGEGRSTTDREEAARLSGALRNQPQLLRARARAGLDCLAAQPQVDPRRLAAMGFCFGGTTVLELAYSGADLQGVVSFHGGLPLPQAGEGQNLKAKVLVLHGADDPFLKPQEVAAFEEALRQAGADWQLVLFGGAVHSFTNPEATRGGVPGVAYNARVAARAFGYLRLFLQEVFGAGGK